MRITKDELNLEKIADIDQKLLDSVIRSCNFILSLYEGLPSIEKNNRLVSYGIKDLDRLTFSKKSDESCYDKETVALKGLLIFFIERLSLYRRVLFLRFDDYRKKLFQCESPSKDIISDFLKEVSNVYKDLKEMRKRPLVSDGIPSDLELYSWYKKWDSVFACVGQIEELYALEKCFNIGRERLINMFSMEDNPSVSELVEGVNDVIIGHKEVLNPNVEMTWTEDNLFRKYRSNYMRLLRVTVGKLNPNDIVLLTNEYGEDLEKLAHKVSNYCQSTLFSVQEHVNKSILMIKDAILRETLKRFSSQEIMSMYINVGKDFHNFYKLFPKTLPFTAKSLFEFLKQYSLNHATDYTLDYNNLSNRDKKRLGKYTDIFQNLSSIEIPAGNSRKTPLQDEAEEENNYQSISDSVLDFVLRGCSASYRNLLFENFGQRLEKIRDKYPMNLNPFSIFEVENFIKKQLEISESKEMIGRFSKGAISETLSLFADDDRALLVEEYGTYVKPIVERFNTSLPATKKFLFIKFEDEIRKIKEKNPVITRLLVCYRTGKPIGKAVFSSPECIGCFSQQAIKVKGSNSVLCKCLDCDKTENK